jgi:hypothetical protein
MNQRLTRYLENTGSEEEFAGNNADPAAADGKKVAGCLAFSRRRIMNLIYAAALCVALPETAISCGRKDMFVDANMPSNATGPGITPIAVSEDVPGQNRNVVRLFYQNFDYRKHQPFKNSAPREWDYPRKDADLEAKIPLMLSQSVNEDLDYPVPVDELFKFSFNSGFISVVPVFSKGEMIKQYLAGRGVDAVSAEAQGYKMFTVTGKGGKKVKMTIYPDRFEIEGTGKDGKPRTISMMLPNEGYGVHVKVSQLKDRDGHKWQVTRKSKMTGPQGESAVFDTKNGYTYIPAKDSPPIEISSAESFLKFLSTCKSKQIFNEFTSMQNCNSNLCEIIKRGDFKDMKGIEQLIDIFRNMPKEPSALAAFFKFSVNYAQNDKTLDDEYRHPVAMVSSGWGDCDDYVMINYLWAHLHNYVPQLVYISKTEKNPTKEEPGHVLVWYADEEGRITVRDNEQYKVMAKGKTINDYLARQWAGYSIRFNGRP